MVLYIEANWQYPYEPMSMQGEYDDAYLYATPGRMSEYS